jgi:hypothetical protein
MILGGLYLLYFWVNQHKFGLHAYSANYYDTYFSRYCGCGPTTSEQPLKRRCLGRTYSLPGPTPKAVEFMVSR